MKPGDTYTIAESEADVSEHAGHVVTVESVRPTWRHPVESHGDSVHVRCQCGDAWTFEDRT